MREDLDIFEKIVSEGDGCKCQGGVNGTLEVICVVADQKVMMVVWKPKVNRKGSKAQK